MQLYLLKEAAALVAQPDEDLAPVGEVLPHRGGEALQTAAEKQEKLRRAVFRLREAPVTVSGRQRPRAAAQVGQPLPQTADELLKNDEKPTFTLLDFHAEATSEKLAMAYYLDGRVSALWGTHTHVPTADEEVFPKGTGYLTDLGMTGAVRIAPSASESASSVSR